MKSLTTKEVTSPTTNSMKKEVIMKMIEGLVTENKGITLF